MMPVTATCDSQYCTFLGHLGESDTDRIISICFPTARGGQSKYSSFSHISLWLMVLFTNFTNVNNPLGVTILEKRDIEFDHTLLSCLSPTYGQTRLYLFARKDRRRNSLKTMLNSVIGNDIICKFKPCLHCQSFFMIMPATMTCDSQYYTCLGHLAWSNTDRIISICCPTARGGQSKYSSFSHILLSLMVLFTNFANVNNPFGVTILEKHHIEFDHTLLSCLSPTYMFKPASI